MGDPQFLDIQKSRKKKLFFENFQFQKKFFESIEKETCFDSEVIKKQTL